MHKEVYLAYFDLLGFKEFIKNNTSEHLSQRMVSLFLDLEEALTKNKHKMEDSGLYRPDIGESKLNCINISDTILYWTNDLSYDSLCELFMTAFLFNHSCNTRNFPARGCLMKGTIDHISGANESKNDTVYAVQCLYGKGLVDAHDKAESQYWAGTVIDKSIENDLNHYLGQKLLDSYCVKYRIPYKPTKANLAGDIGNDEYAFRLFMGDPNPTFIKNIKDNVKRIFASDNKPTSIQSVQDKLNNTLKYLDFLANR